jgi:hypothetical protein
VTVLPSGGSLASISSSPEKPQDILIDSGATNHVTPLHHLFISFTPTNTQLRVALEEQLPVVGVGLIMLSTPNGLLRLSKVLFCPNVQGTVFSVGFFHRWDGSVSFSDCFVLRQNDSVFSSYNLNYRWFISILRPFSPLSPVSSSPSLSAISAKLWHS